MIAVNRKGSLDSGQLVRVLALIIVDRQTIIISTPQLLPENNLPIFLHQPMMNALAMTLVQSDDKCHLLRQ